jgi:hypothetical protein
MIPMLVMEAIVALFIIYYTHNAPLHLTAAQS